ncbi:MAG: GH36-type glycosyl hydrolase domain-containing protein [Chloroflexota bacterium]
MDARKGAMPCDPVQLGAEWSSPVEEEPTIPITRIGAAADAALVVGSYPDAAAGRLALRTVRRRGFRRAAAIHSLPGGRTVVEDNDLSPLRGAFGGGLLALAFAIGYLFLLVRTGVPRDAAEWLAYGTFVAVGALAGWLVSRWLDLGVRDSVLDRYRRWVTAGETLVVVEVEVRHARTVLGLLRNSEDVLPATFIIRPRRVVPGRVVELQRRECFSGERLKVHAAWLANRHAGALRARRPQPLWTRLSDGERIIDTITLDLAQAVQLEQSISVAAEWLLDNAYVIQRQIADVRRNLSHQLYDVLPTLEVGPRDGEPRAYDLAAELVAHVDAELAEEDVVNFLIAYQGVSPLSMSELWALPLLLRLALLESLSYLATRIDEQQHEFEWAEFWANRLLVAARRVPDDLLFTLAELAREHPNPSTVFADRLIGQLQGESLALGPVLAWLELKWGQPVLDAIQQEERRHAADQTTIANGIGSLRLLARLDWRDVFEQVSLVEDVLRADPADVYRQMDFGTRDRYRHVVEEIARRSRKTELEVARAAVAASAVAGDDRSGHVGYYLIDAGRPPLEISLGYRATVRQRLRLGILRRPAAWYLGSIGLGTALVLAILLALLGPPDGDWAWLFALGGLGLLALVPASEIAMQVMNFVVATALHPQPLPKLAFDDGVPDEWRTLVVVPTLLVSLDSIRENLAHLEIHYLADRDANLRFALLADLVDAHEREIKGDTELIQAAVRGIDLLNARYAGNRFALFFRPRRWSKSERCWMGWERKRGKLEELNAWLLGEAGTSAETLRPLAGELSQLEGVRFVITLDADTQLPYSTARRLIGALAHPLNRPRLASDGRRVVAGYTIIQPRVSSSLPSVMATRFARVFADSIGVDPYSHVVSDLYQDLAGEGSYYGKGIYDVATFHRMLGGRFPSATLLSHDLLEGAHVRVGMATDIELFDACPRGYLAETQRQHRWVRGDWQIAAWCRTCVPAANGGREPNPLGVLSRWKLVDNLRRSLMPVTSVALLLVGWFALPRAGVLLGLLVGLTIVLPPALRLAAWVPSQPWAVLTSRAAWREQGLVWLRALIALALLAHQAVLMLDAIARTIGRTLVSHRNLLEWQTAAVAGGDTRAGDLRLTRQLALVSLASFGVGVALVVIGPATAPSAVLFLLPWLLSPAIVAWLEPALSSRPERAMADSDRRMLRRIARETWRYFDDFVGPESNWLPPDNYQQAPREELAERTSPTNIGLWLLATLAAHDFGYLTPDQVVARGQATLDTIERLERCEGHLLNWYHTRTLQPLPPRYVSTVDSGNLLASLWTLAQGYRELLSRPLIGPEALCGLADTLALVHIAEWSSSEVSGGVHAAHLGRLIEDLSELFTDPPGQQDAIVGRVRAAVEPAHELAAALRGVSGAKPGESSTGQVAGAAYWATQVERQVMAWLDVVDRYVSFAGTQEDRRAVMARYPGAPALASSPRSLANDERPAAREGQNVGGGDHSATCASALGAVVEPQAADLVARVEGLIARVERLADAMSLRFLYDHKRRLFPVGYNVDQRRFDSSYYDLLASEARLASLVAVARGDVPAEHWFALGRLFGKAQGHRVLLSWSGTMFEYLMPLLLMRSYRHTLLDEAHREAVALQIEYGRQQGVPWGISESAFAAIDVNQIYQYQAFGVPGLGLKRGLADDLVIAPYASALTLMVDPAAAVANLERLAQAGLHGDYGYFESIDYTRQRQPAGGHGVVVRAFMVHHQGMALLALDNALHSEIMPGRFHADRRVQAAEPVLFERAPVAPLLVEATERAEPPARLQTLGSVEPMTSVDAPAPATHLLGNGSYTVMVTAAGGGFSRWRDLDVTRWRADTTLDAHGTFYYIKDVDNGMVWSAAHQPTRRPASRYLARFSPERVEVERRDFGIGVTTTVSVSPDDSAEIRYLTIANYSNRRRRLELTSYVELALTSHGADLAHPAFGNLFVVTEAVPVMNALLAHRKPRMAHDRTIWAGHCLALPTTTDARVVAQGFETDRTHFLGRGRSPENPLALETELAGSVGPVLDPIFSLRCEVALDPGEQVELAFVTTAAESREGALALIQKYQDLHVARQALEAAANRGQTVARQLGVTADDLRRFQVLAGPLLYPNARLRASERQLRRNQLGQAGLWAHGISGDLPILLVTIGDRRDMEVVREALLAHAYWRLLGFAADLVILNEEVGGYEQRLQGDLRRVMQRHAPHTPLDQPGGVFLRPAEPLATEELTLLFAAARAVLVAARGPLVQQLGIPADLRELPPSLAIGRRASEEPSGPLPFLELPYFNGLGGFTPDGREYAIYLGPGARTPAPWVNVLANPDFGVLVSESGPGFAWAANSQANRLIPWGNDPVSDPPGEGIYIRDEHLGVFWTPTAAPIRELDAYRARHGQGYTVFEHNSHALEQELVTFVPLDEAGGAPVRIQRLRLRNRSSRRRRLSVFAYADWVLGTNREETQMHLVSGWDAASQMLHARNPYHPDFPSRVAFASASPAPQSFSADRGEFLGRNGDYARPAALLRQTLSGQSGAGLDPCAALQVVVEVDPGQETEVTFLFGEAMDTAGAQRLVERFRDPVRVEQALQETRAFWDRLLETAQVETPDLSVNFLLNRWLLYQTLSCRIWARSGLYQSGGAIGFRDQLQDSLALVYGAPEITRQQILAAAARQFIGGDVQHWWHPHSGAGVRTRISDDLLWLPYATAQYVRVTGDAGILDEAVPFLEGRTLADGEDEAYFVPTATLEAHSLLEHCRRAINRGLTSGPHGLPLIGTGDWNDGLNRVGAAGRGESVWLAWFLVDVLGGFAELLEGSGGSEEARECRSKAQHLLTAVEEHAWDGEWYRRAYFDDGTPLGSRDNTEAWIDSLPQSWAVISGAADPARAEKGLRSVEEHLVRAADGLVLLFTPPFEKSSLDPGYVKGYPPGVRENGGQYTHAALWVAMALARRGEGDRAVNILRLLNPVEHARTPDAVERYRVEPYVVAGDVYSLAGHVGQGGWTWYTGSAGWMYRVWLEEVLGVKLRGNMLEIDPVIPAGWPGFVLRCRLRGVSYEIRVENPEHVGHGVAWVEVDGRRQPKRAIVLVDDGRSHSAVVRLGSCPADAPA